MNRPYPEDPTDGIEANHEIREELYDDEILAAIKSLKNNKAAGIDNINAELIKNGGHRLHIELIRAVKRIWNSETMPEEWEGIYVALHKKGARTECSNFRGLCILTVGYKIIAKILYRRLLQYHSNIVGEYQSGFTPGKST